MVLSYGGLKDMGQLKFKEALHSNGQGAILVTLEDGRCATADLIRGGVIIEILLDSFYKWGAFDEPVSGEEEQKAKEVINNATPEKIWCSRLAQEYLLKPDTKKFFDKLKKKANYNY